MTDKRPKVHPFATKSRRGFKFIGSCADDDRGVGDLVEGFEVAKFETVGNEDGVLFINLSEDSSEPDWVAVHSVYEAPVMAAITPIDEEDIKLHPDWRL